MDDPLAKTRAITQVMRTVKFLAGDQRPLPSVATTIAELVAMFNALTLPRCYLAVDSGLCHLVFISSNDDSFQNRGPLEIRHMADVIWRYDPLTSLWRTMKDRTGEYERRCPIHFSRGMTLPVCGHV